MFLSRKIGSGLAGPKAKPTRLLVSVFFFLVVFPPRRSQAGSTDKVTEVSTLQVPIRLVTGLRGTAQQQRRLIVSDEWRARQINKARLDPTLEAAMGGESRETDPSKLDAEEEI
ncbi:hypothetical protein BO83DRAFT_412524 [Aspergillus eucalypticola CBS 122712]|uniref:Uncharacterized protein n=1 Tax=Aspergillus eucalypticola (strain CBS 122712 / IBT 29274) TaxID=1448314 RepID=A0A317UM13_ASPEC|nr:uncharacterized protein BO83DRAFT_412524 [Aspergillus eucalypticola CBS 122712]PWY62525.1 hypothetical protein BO83DRAFT_412524 [Aspergillus eucalypticola CBS 122712]